MTTLTLAKLLKAKKALDEAEKVPCEQFIEFYRQPRTKKRRIIRKWQLRPGNWRMRTIYDGRLIPWPEEQENHRRQFKAFNEACEAAKEREAV